MKRLIFLAVVGFVLNLTCHAQDGRYPWPSRDPRLLAINDDTVVSCKMEIDSNSRFVYTIKDTLAGKIVVEDFKGSVRITRDTIYLSYEDKMPARAYPLLLRAHGPGGDYLSQRFKIRRKIMYLAIVFPTSCWR